MITLQLLKKHFKTEKNPNKKDVYLLYDLDKNGNLTSFKYVGEVFSDGKSFAVKGFPAAKTVTELMENLVSYAAALPFDIEYYNPSYRKGYFEEAIIHRWMKDLGFESQGENFNLSIKNAMSAPTIISISIVGLDGFEKLQEVCQVNLWIADYSWVTFECKRNAEELIATLSYAINLSGGIIAGNVLDILKKIEIAVAQIDIQKNTMMNNFSVITENYKNPTIEILEKLLENLKK